MGLPTKCVHRKTKWFTSFRLVRVLVQSLVVLTEERISQTSTSIPREVSKKEQHWERTETWPRLVMSPLTWTFPGSKCVCVCEREREREREIGREGERITICTYCLILLML